MRRFPFTCSWPNHKIHIWKLASNPETQRWLEDLQLREIPPASPFQPFSRRDQRKHLRIKWTKLTPVLNPSTGSVHRPVNPSLNPKKNACAKLDRGIFRDYTEITFPPSFIPLLKPFIRPGLRTVDPYNAGAALKPSAIESIICHIPKNGQIIFIQAHK